MKQQNKIAISISISNDLLAKIEKTIEGRTRSEKMTRCLEVGYILLARQPASTLKILKKGLERHARR